MTFQTDKSPPTPPAGSSGPGGVEGANRGAAASPGATPPERPTPPDRPSGGSTRAGRGQSTLGKDGAALAGTKRCYRCQTFKGPTAFHRNRAQKDGLDTVCRACSKTRNKQRWADRVRPAMREGWCAYCRAGRHGRECEAAVFGPDCACGCGILGYRDWSVPSGDLTAPAATDSGVT